MKTYILIIPVQPGRSLTQILALLDQVSSTSALAVCQGFHSRPGLAKPADTAVMATGSCSGLRCSDWWPECMCRIASPGEEVPSQHKVMESHHMLLSWHDDINSSHHGAMSVYHDGAVSQENVQLPPYVHWILLSGLRFTWIWMLDYTLWCTCGKHRIKIIKPKWHLVPCIRFSYLNRSLK